MKSKLMAGLLCLSLVFLWGCKSTPPPTISFNDVIANPESYLYKSAFFTDGVIVFHTVKEGVSIAVVTPFPVPKIDKQQIEAQVMAIKLPDSTGVSIGNIVKVKGGLRKIKKDEKVIYYIDALSVEITGEIETQDPDFEEIVNAISEEYRNNEDGWFLFFLLFILLNPANPASPLYYGPPN